MEGRNEPLIYIYNVQENCVTTLTQISDEEYSSSITTSPVSYTSLEDVSKWHEPYIFAGSKDELLNKMMKISIDTANQVLALSRELRLLDSKEFIDWQDELNEISVKYE